MALSDNAPLAEAGNSIPGSKWPDNSPLSNPELDDLTNVKEPNSDPDLGAVTGQTLPAWSAALPLWASTNWLWLVHASSGPIHYWTGTVGQITAAGQTPTMEQAPFTISYSLIVLDYRAVGELDDGWWSLIERMLAPGGLLFVCYKRNKRLPRRVRASAPGLHPSTWHIIKPGQEENWHFRPATSSMRRIILEQNQPYTTRTWLARMLYRWLPQPGEIDCLPVWRGGVRA